MQKVDSLRVMSNEILLSQATLNQLNELIESCRGPQVNSENINRNMIFGVIQDLINSELPKLMVESPEARNLILNKMSEVAEF